MTVELLLPLNDCLTGSLLLDKIPFLALKRAVAGFFDSFRRLGASAGFRVRERGYLKVKAHKIEAGNIIANKSRYVNLPTKRMNGLKNISKSSRQSNLVGNHCLQKLQQFQKIEKISPFSSTAYESKSEKSERERD